MCIIPENQKWWTVYVHTFPNGKRYVGATSQNPERRWNAGKGYAHQTRMRRAIQEYGWENIEHHIIASGLPQNDAYDLEISLINQYRSNEDDYGYNASFGGEKGSLGAKRLPEHIKSMSERLKGICPPPHVMQLAHDGKRNWKVPLETRKKMSEAQMGSKNHEYGKRKTDSQKQHLSDVLSVKPVVCTETNVKYKNAKYAAEAVGLKSGSGIIACCKGRRKTAGGYHWRYANV